jgi:hypothetical protein
MMSEKEDIAVSAVSAIHGHLYSTEGAILNGAKVYCNDRETLSLADGFYAFKDLPPGRHEVRVDLEGFELATQTVLTREKEVAVLDFHLSKDLGSATISGQVYDKETGAAITSGGSIILIQPISNRYATIDGKGHYAFDNLRAGTYRLSTSIPEYDDTDALLTVIDSESVIHDFYCNLNKEVEPAWG